MVRKKGIIQFHIQYKPFTLRNRTVLKQYILQLLQAEGKLVSHINYIFCADDYLLEINKQYLSHNTYTDIISFPYSEDSEPITGDIYISIDRVKENAIIFKTSFNAELHRVIFHGALHFAGFNDKKKGEKMIMRQKEDYYLEHYL